MENRATAEARFKEKLPKGKHSLQLYSCATRKNILQGLRLLLSPLMNSRNLTFIVARS
jgi:hypothetical protein